MSGSFNSDEYLGISGGDSQVISTESIGARSGQLADIKSRTAVAVPVVGIVASEALLYFEFTNYTIWAYAITLLVCTLAPLRLPGETGVFAALALVAVFRLVNLTMPAFFEDPVLWLVSVYAPLLPVLLFLYSRQEVSGPDTEVRWMPPVMALLALPLGVGLGHVEFFILEPDPLVPAWTPTQIAVVSLVSIGLVGAVEELLFRGIMQRRLQSRFGRWVGLVVTSAIFGVMHAVYHLPAEIAFAASVGFLFGLIYDWTDSVTLVAVVHGVLNVVLFAAIPINGSILNALL